MLYRGYDLALSGWFTWFDIEDEKEEETEEERME